MKEKDGLEEIFAALKEMHRHPLTYLLKAADNIAYAAADLEDGFNWDILTE